MAAFNIESSAAVVLDPESIVEASDNNTAVSKLPHTTLAGVGLATAGMATYTAVYRRPSCHELAYFLLLGAAFIAGIVEVWAALWVSHNATARRRKGKMILYASVVPFVIALGLRGFGVNPKN
ncbi:hypothetical protein ACQ4PT_053983 [Festuca glaucescens]